MTQDSLKSLRDQAQRVQVAWDAYFSVIHNSPHDHEVRYARWREWDAEQQRLARLEAELRAVR